MNVFALRKSSLMTLFTVAMSALLAACAAAMDVTETGKPGIYTVSASATGGRLAWARAHERAATEAREYCDRRGMQPEMADKMEPMVMMSLAPPSS